MRTLIVSDLHLGATSRVDLLRRPELRAVLFEALQGIDRLVLLGDVLELRHGPRAEALAAARPFFEDLGRAFADREVVVSAGNHDHALIEPWLANRGVVDLALDGHAVNGHAADGRPRPTRGEPSPLSLEQRIAPEDASPMLARIAEWSAPARVSVAYPGLWVREDVYATHGHYLDCHLTIPTMERLGIAVMGRVLRRPAAGFSRVEDYEAVAAPVFAWIDAVSRQERTGAALNGASTVRAWRALRGGGSGSRRGGAGRRARASRRQGSSRPIELVEELRTRALVGAFSLAVTGLNRAGLGPLRPDISTAELRRAGLRAMGEVADRLGVEDAHVVFGHTHRAGLLSGDDPAEWVGCGGARLVNCGCWTYDGYFLTDTPGESPYWPGGCVLVEEEGPPRVRRLLDDLPHADLEPPAEVELVSTNVSV